MNKALQVLQERGFFQQCSNLDALSDLMDKGPVTFYVGCDPTGPSLHIGHMVPFFAMRHLRQFGHKAVALLGGGTARIGDPSGKTEMRKMISYEEIEKNAQSMAAQLDRFIGFDGTNALTANNADWLSSLNYIDFLRDIGSHFSVNKMLSFEAYKKRMETGLSFVEFNYQLLQSYDFHMLNKNYGVRLQIGGDDQWGNIVAGIDLIRRLGGPETYGLTFPLITTSDGKKMGKTEKGALFLDEGLCSSFDFFQYFRNCTDADLPKFLKLFTFLPTSEIDALCHSKEAKEINAAKEVLAFEITKLIHGEDKAAAAREAAKAAFGGGQAIESIPPYKLDGSLLAGGILISEIMVSAGFAASKTDARRLIEQGGVSVGEEKVKTFDQKISSIPKDEALLLRSGKKKVVRLIV